jgi:hypothetical protein
MAARQTSCRQQTAKMSHARSPTAAGSHSLAGADSAPHCGTEFRSTCQSLRALVMQSSAPSPGALSWDSELGDIEDSISQCPFLQKTYTAENQHADGSATPGARPRFRTPRRRDPHVTSPAPTTTGWQEDRCPVVSKRPLHCLVAAKMSPHILISPEPVLTDHAPSLPAEGSHCQAREDSAPHCRTEFLFHSVGCWVDCQPHCLGYV